MEGSFIESKMMLFFFSQETSRMMPEEILSKKKFNLEVSLCFLYMYFLIIQ